MFILIESRTDDIFEALDCLSGEAFNSKDDAVEAMKKWVTEYVVDSGCDPSEADDYIEFDNRWVGPCASVENGWEWRIIKVPGTVTFDKEG